MRVRELTRPPTHRSTGTRFCDPGPPVGAAIVAAVGTNPAFARTTAVAAALASRPGVGDGRLWADVLADVPLFAGVSKRHVRGIAKLTREATYHAGREIVRAGSPGSEFFVVLDGEVSVRRPGGRSPLSIGPGGYFGEMSLIDGGTRSATIVAKTDVRCLRLARAPFLRMLSREPEIAKVMLRELAGRVRRLEKPSAQTTL